MSEQDMIDAAISACESGEWAEWLAWLTWLVGRIEMLTLEGIGAPADTTAAKLEAAQAESLDRLVPLATPSPREPDAELPFGAGWPFAPREPDAELREAITEAVEWALRQDPRHAYQECLVCGGTWWAKNERPSHRLDCMVPRWEAALRSTGERLTVQFACPMCGTVNEPTQGEIVMDKPYQCHECMTALVFSVRSPELDAERGVPPGDGAPQW